MAARSWAKRTRLRLHHRVPHAVRRIRQGADRPAGAADLCLDAPVPRRRRRAPWWRRQSLRDELAARGFRNIRAWSRGVDLDAVQAGAARGLGTAAAGVPLCRPGGGGEEHRRVPRSRPAGLEGRGRRRAAAWRRCGASIRTCCSPARATARRWRAPTPARDVFVFPSLTDTFGLVLLEALACGTPVAAFPVTGPKDVLADAAGKIGAVNADLRAAALEALTRRSRGLPGACRALFVARLRRDVPVASGAADGGGVVGCGGRTLDHLSRSLRERSRSTCDAGEGGAALHHPHPRRFAPRPLPQRRERCTWRAIGLPRRFARSRLASA